MNNEQRITELETAIEGIRNRARQKDYADLEECVPYTSMIEEMLGAAEHLVTAASGLLRMRAYIKENVIDSARSEDPTSEPKQENDNETE